MDRAVFDLKNERPSDAELADRIGVRYVFGVGEYVWQLDLRWAHLRKDDPFVPWCSYKVDEPDTGGQVQDRIRPLFSHILMRTGRTPAEYAMPLSGIAQAFISKARVPREKDGLPTFTCLWGGKYGWGLRRWRNVADLVGTEFYCLGGSWRMWVRCLVKLAVVAWAFRGRPWVAVCNSYVRADLKGVAEADTLGGTAPLRGVEAWQIRFWERTARMAGASIFALLGWSEMADHREDDPARMAILRAWSS